MLYLDDSDWSDGGATKYKHLHVEQRVQVCQDRAGAAEEERVGKRRQEPNNIGWDSG